MSQMDAKQAASLIEKWIAFYDMDNPQAWDRDDYAFVQQACRDMRAAVQTLRGKGNTVAAQQRKLADGLEEFIEDSFMDDPHEWEPENRAFVKQAMEALQYTAAQLRKSAPVAGKPVPGGAKPHNQAVHSKTTARPNVTHNKGTNHRATNQSATNKSSTNRSATYTNATHQNATSNNSTNKHSTSKNAATRSTASIGAPHRAATTGKPATGKTNNSNTYKPTTGKINEQANGQGKSGRKGKPGGR
ncbi:hypothetical protein [Paenibacillus campi]|uniref:hypothetical protein n=1 Tax=Paenibacillus campi TaxID=3106031 RepID=UPI002AFED180|nr:hypothetical protein [Paenibacillus sp. SGZ-1009]